MLKWIVVVIFVLLCAGALHSPAEAGPVGMTLRNGIQSMMIALIRYAGNLPGHKASYEFASKRYPST